MTQLTLSMLLRADGAPAAKAAIEGVATATDRLGTATTRGATAERAAASAKQANAQANRVLASTSNAASGATGNLVANFNDLFMMIGAGQNPLQTAVQQGTQITQVIGPMGAAGAAKALGGAFVAMLSPINLVTLGAIAAGSAFIQWLTAADDDAAAVTAELERQKSALQGIIDETEKLRLARGMMLTGAASENEQRILEENNRLLAEREAIDARLAAQGNVIGNARAAAALAEMEARREAINVQIGANNVTLYGLELERQRTAELEENRAAAQGLKSVADAIAAAIARAAAGDMSGPFLRAQGAANALLGIANNILAALGQAAAERAAYSESVGGGRGLGAQGPALDPYGFRAQLSRDARARPVIRVPGGGGGGGAATRDEANALQELIASLEGEIEALRVRDPIQQELLKNREAMAGATEAEKQKVEELIATRERETLAMEGLKARREFFESLGNNALDALIVKGESFNAVLKQIGLSLIQAGIQAALFGSGPFGSLFGGTSVLSMIFPSFAAKADGGIIRGPGTGTSDSILARLSNGEFVVNARATERNRGLLEAINSNRLPGYATGGMVGRGSGGGGDSYRRSGPDTVVIDMRGTKGNREIEDIAFRATRRGLELYDREGAGRAYQRVSRDPKRVN